MGSRPGASAPGGPSLRPRERAMLNLFRKRESGGGAPPEGPPGSALASHVLVKFLKRLRAMERPHLLDLGHLSGANIEFFAQAGCKVQVEDIFNASETAPDDTLSEPPPAGDPAGSETARAVPPQPEAVQVARTTPTGAPVGLALPIPARAAGPARTRDPPPRRIGLPPRPFRAPQAAGEPVRDGRLDRG